jgi:hypothetical protein
MDTEACKTDVGVSSQDSDSDVSENSTLEGFTSSDAASVDTPSGFRDEGGAGQALLSPRLGRMPPPVPRLNIAQNIASNDSHDNAEVPKGSSSLAQTSKDGSGKNNSPTSGHVAVDLLSPAFDLATSQYKNALEFKRQCAGKFGVREDRVRLFALLELASGAEVTIQDCKRVAVHIEGSAFSLQAIEEVLTENQRLSQGVNAAVALPRDRSSEIELLRREVSSLQARLKNSELLRHRGQQALQELKEEFETLHFDLLRHSDSLDGTPTTVHTDDR